VVAVTVRWVYVCDRCGRETTNPAEQQEWRSVDFPPSRLFCPDCFAAVERFATAGALVGESS